MYRQSIVLLLIPLVGLCQSAVILGTTETPPVPPTPSGCTYNDNFYSAGTTFDPDPCISCNCPDGGGEALCIAMSCAPINCVDFFKEPDECCPSCSYGTTGTPPVPPTPPGCTYNDNFYPEGTTFDPDPCISCNCPDGGGEALCIGMSCAPINCVDFFKEPDECCPSCSYGTTGTPPVPPTPPGCTYNDNFYPEGTTFDPDPCISCNCPDGGGEALCIAMSCAPINCVDFFKEPDECCPSCSYGTTGTPPVPPTPPGCTYNDNFYSEGTTFDPEPCISCTCPDGGGEALCYAMACLPISCVDFVIEPDECCPSCSYGTTETPPVPPTPPGCTYNDNFYSEGTAFDPEPCISCTCPDGGGEALCLAMACPPISCVDFVIEPDECCTSCPNGPNCQHSNNKVYPAGEFQPSPCEFCHCFEDGRISCAIQDCVVPICVDYVQDPNKCCPVCPNGPNCWAGTRKIPADKDVEIDGEICRCKDHPDHLDHQAECYEIPKPMCQYNGTEYPPGEFSPSPCEKCMCPDEGGIASCRPMACETPTCVDAVKPENQCCLTCPNGPNCYHRGKIVAAGTFFERRRKKPPRVCKCPDLQPDQDPATRKAVCTRSLKKLKKALNAA